MPLGAALEELRGELLTIVCQPGDHADCVLNAHPAQGLKLATAGGPRPALTANGTTGRQELVRRRGPHTRRVHPGTTAAGMTDIEITETHRVHEHAGSAIVCCGTAATAGGCG